MLRPLYRVSGLCAEALAAAERRPVQRPPFVVGAPFPLAGGEALALGTGGDGRPVAARLAGDRWRALPPPSLERRETSFALLPDGRLLLGGGVARNDDRVTRETETFVP